MLVTFVMAENTSEALNCEQFNETDPFAITPSCALFDFTVYTVTMGILTTLGVIGQAVEYNV